jgi:glutamate N-acetyltransferase/amino-acid N-acetyltransferase
LALALSERPAAAAGVFTTNLFKAAPVMVASDMLIDRRTARAVLINTGQANACTGDEGIANCLRAQKLVAAAAGIDPRWILPASTGVIGVQLKMDLWERAAPLLAANLGQGTVEEFAAAMMTTDRFPKFASEQVSLDGATVTLTGMAKGAGMICPNMATMLALVLCDAEVPADAWQRMFNRAADATFNRVTVDGDTSTNDTLFGLANGASGVRPQGNDLLLLEKTLGRILSDLAYKLVADGEGATKVIHIHVRGAASAKDAERAARSVGNSQLVKTAMYGKDANWGRIVAALGRSGADFNPRDVRVSLCGVEMFRDEQPTPLDFDALLKEPLEQADVRVDIALGCGTGEYSLLASDLTHEYVNINADYRS